MSSFVNQGHSDWQNILGKQKKKQKKKHACKECHSTALSKPSETVERFEKVVNIIDYENS